LVVKLSRIAARKAAGVAGLSWALVLGFSCAQGEDLSSSHNDAGSRGGAGGGFATGAGGSSGAAGFLGTGGSSSSTGGSTGNGGFIGVGGSSSTATGGSSGSVFTGAGGTSGGGGQVFLGIGGSSPSDSGSAGTAGGGSDFDGPVTIGLQVAYHSTQANQIAFNLEITNNGVDSPAINTLKVRYYFSDEGFSAATSIIFDYAAWNGPGAPYNLPITSTCTASLTLLPVGNAMATSYFEFACDSPAVISPTDKVTLQVRCTTPGEDVTNDFSYTAGDGGLSHDEHIVIYQGANVAFGTPP
jgi:hypothetical protein